jgi:hypothetical protein
MSKKINVRHDIPIPKGVPNIKGKLSLELTQTEAKELAWAYEKQGDRLAKSNDKSKIRQALESYQYAEYVYKTVSDIRAVRDVKVKRERTLASIGLPKDELYRMREAHEQTVRVLTPMGMIKASGAVAVLSIFGSFIFLSSNLTGNVIGNMDKVTTGWIGGLLFAVGLVFAFFYFKKRK